MGTIVGIIIAIIALVVKIMEEKSSKTAPKTQHPDMTMDEVLRRHKELVERQMRQAQEQQDDANDEYSDEDNTDDDEYEDDEETIPTYEPIPAAYNEPVPVQAPQPAEFLYQQNMSPTPLTDGLPVEGVSAFANNQVNDDTSALPTPDQQDSSLTADDMRRAIIYQTILERPKF